MPTSAKTAPATQAINALPFCLQFAPFPVCPPAPKLSAALNFAHNISILKVFASSPLRGIGSLVTFFVLRQRK
jgi:hypothetical protein